MNSHDDKPTCLFSAVAFNKFLESSCLPVHFPDFAIVDPDIEHQIRRRQKQTLFKIFIRDCLESMEQRIPIRSSQKQNIGISLENLKGAKNEKKNKCCILTNAISSHIVIGQGEFN